MVSALGLAFSQIVPSLEKFQTESDLVAATNTFLSFDSEIKKLISSPDGCANVVRYNLESGTLDVSQEREIFLLITAGGINLFNNSVKPGEVAYTLEGNFRGSGGVIYDFGSPILMVYSVNRTTQMTNIIHQSFNGYKMLKLYYSLFVNVEIITETKMEINFIVIHLNTTRTEGGQGEYFPVVNEATMIKVEKKNQYVETYDLGTRTDDLSITASTLGFSQLIEYPIAPLIFDLTLNIIHIEIDLSTA
ncbi:hypothetical protein EU534_01545 [Candidatus Heimdallarchaeota archaeon]|nr:MAG: hypothetical protein EU534_01545 [Candidatus Heimdallarchaeota archaeon]